MDGEKDRFYVGITLLATVRAPKRLLKSIDKIVKSIEKLARHKLQCFSVIILAIDHRRHTRQSPYTILGYLKLLKMLLQQYRSLSLKHKYGQSLEYEGTYIHNFT